MSMTDLFGSDEGSDVEESEDEKSTAQNIKTSEAVGKHGMSSGEQSEEEGEVGEQDVGEDDEHEDEEDNVKDDDEEDRQVEDESKMEEEKSDIEQENDDEQEEGVENKNEKYSENEGSSEQEEAEQSDKEEKQSDEEEGNISKSKNNVSSMDLFGEDVSSEEEDEKEDNNKVEKEQEISTQDEEPAAERQHLGSDEEQEEAPPEETQINIEIPYSKFSLGSEMSFVKLPNFLSVETKPFDPATYEDEFEEDEVMDDEGRSRLKLRVENTVRWRNAKDEEGNDIKESNARVVRWSDGTMSLLLGAEVFDIHKTKIDGEHNHLFVQQGTGLQAQAIFREKLTFRPHSTNSQTHRKMTLSIADRVSKTGKIKILPVVGKDPESQKSELIKKEEEKLRSQLRRENQQRRMRERSNARGLTASYLEPDRYEDDEEALEQSLLAMKKHYKKGLAKGRLGDVYSDEESEEEGISGGLESDDDSAENSADKGAAGLSESDPTRQRKHSFEEPVVKKKRNKVIAVSDEDESD